MSITITIPKMDELSLKLEKAKQMKWLLRMEDSENVVEDLQKEIDDICYKNFTHLIMIHHYLTQMTTKIKNSVDKIIAAKDEPKLCRKLYFDYLKSYDIKSEFQEFERYIYMDRFTETLKDMPHINYANFDKNFNEIKQVVYDFKILQLICIYNIIDNNSFMMFVTKDIMQNIPQLVYWIRENERKPIEDLTTDECEILAGCIYGLSYDDMLEKLHLSSLVNSYKDVQNIISNLPAKFGVLNLTQVMFRIILLKPHIWKQGEHEFIVRSIKGLKDCFED